MNAAAAALLEPCPRGGTAALGCREASETQRRGSSSSLYKRAVLAWWGLLGATGCIAVEDDALPGLSIALFWEDGTGGTSPDDQTCSKAKVEWAVWGLFRETDGGRGDPVLANPPDRPCQDVVHKDEAEQGSYVLVINGGNDSTGERWMATCGNLIVDRFDEAYPCELRSGSPSPGNRQHSDAGIDAGAE